MNMFSFLSAMPEIFLLGALCMVLLLDTFLSEETPLISYLATQLSLWTAALLVYATTFHLDSRQLSLNRMYVVDDLSGVLKISILLLSSLCFVYARKYLREHHMWRGEFFVLGITAILGMMIIASGYNLLVLYLGLELLALSMYGMIAMQRDNSRATEAALKYFVLGAVASGMLLYGISMIYGISGQLELGQLKTHFIGQADLKTNVLFLFALTFIVAGVLFKFGAVPFHMWMPDVYQGAPTAVTLFLSSVPKIAAVAIALRLLAEGLGSDAAVHSWSQMVLVLALLSVVVGNLIAIAQNSLKRMFAYSTIAHMGFLLMGIVTGEVPGYSAAVFYTIVYALMTAGGFGVLILLGREGFDPDNLDSLKGLNERSPWFALMMLLLLLSMAGIPPTVGFYAKLSIIKVVLDAGYLLPAIVLVLMSVVGAYYYLRAIKFMYFDEPEDTAPLTADLDFKLVLSANGLAVLLLGLYPSVLMSICAIAVGASVL